MRNRMIKFVDEINRLASDSCGVHIILKGGQQSHWDHVRNTPNARLFYGIGPAEKPFRTVQYVHTHKEIHDELIKNDNLIFELYLTQIIQNWYDFLSDIYRIILGSNLKRNIMYQIPMERINVDFSKSNNDFIDSVIESAVKNYDFCAANEKLLILKKAFSISTEEWIMYEGHITCIKENIEIRNILQHNLGIIEANNLKNLGVDYLIEDHGQEKIKKTIGMKITRTGFDIENITKSLSYMANMIVAHEKKET